MTGTNVQQTYEPGKVRQILVQLNDCRRYRAERGWFEQRMHRFANWCLGLSMLLFIITALLAWRHAVVPLPDMLRLIAAVIGLLSMLLAILSLVAPILSAALDMWRWKALALGSLLDEIDNDESSAQALAHHALGDLDHARYWLELKVSRYEMRMNQVLGDKTAVFALFALLYAAVQELGGFAWLGTAITSHPSELGVLNTLLVLGLALLLGFSIGALFLQAMVSRYRYQIELLQLATMRKGI